jgi:hypothetical protein
MEALALTFSSGWASGVNAYATVLALGILGRLGVGQVPEGLQRDEVLLAAAALFAIEFVTDKIPYVDSVWDAIHTAIRPSIGAAIGLLIAGDAGNLSEALGAGTGGTAALASHAVKAGFRLLINLSPEPFSNIAVSLVEDASVFGMVGLALAAPLLAAALAALLLSLGIWLLWRMSRLARRVLVRRRGVSS